MSELMRKIVYYENILEFKENTKSELNLTELNNWQLCRTCLIETSADDVDMEMMCVMDALKGRFLNVQEMLINITGLELSCGLELPLKVCKECLGKITTLYFFTMQVRNAEKVLKKLAIKLNGLIKQNDSTTSMDNVDTIPNNGPEKHFINEEVLSDQYDTKDVVIEMDMQSDTDLKSLSDNGETNDVENLVCLNVSVKPKTSGQNDYIFSEGKQSNNTQNSDYIVKKKHYFYNDSQDNAEVSNDEKASKSVCIEEKVILKTDEQFEDNANTNDSQKLQISAMDYPTETVTKHFKHKQPRVKQSLLDDIKCAICEQIFHRQRCLVEHVQQFHPSSKAFKCRDCGMLFSHIQSLSRHMNTHKDMVIKNMCKFCNKSFLRVDDLKRHIRIHTGERPYMCTLCDKAFKQQGEMKGHQLTHYPLSKHLDSNQCERVHTGERSFSCSLCQKTFTQKFNLKTHHINVHLKHKLKDYDKDQLDTIKNIESTSTKYDENYTNLTHIHDVNAVNPLIVATNNVQYSSNSYAAIDDPEKFFNSDQTSFNDYLDEISNFKKTHHNKEDIDSIGDSQGDSDIKNIIEISKTEYIHDETYLTVAEVLEGISNGNNSQQNQIIMKERKIESHI